MTTTAPRHDSIADALRREILRGTYAPGDRLPAERDLAVRLGAHRSSVREALRKLEQQGLVAIRHGGGARVRGLEFASLEVARELLFVDGALNRPALEQLLEVHEMLICGATRLAVEKATPAEREEARALLARLVHERDDDDAFIDGVEQLLDLIVRASRNLVLHLARRTVNPLFEARFREIRKRLRPGPALFASAAREIGAALDARDADAAERSVRRFLRARRRHAVDALEALHRSRPESHDAPTEKEEPPHGR